MAIETPNNRQVGGSHYNPNSERQHWDIMDDYGYGYLEGCASKYLMRYRNKHGLQDLEKSEHYIEKILHNHFTKGRQPRGSMPSLILDEFLTEHDLHGTQRRAVEQILCWRTAGDLAQVIHSIQQLKLAYTE